MPTYTKYLPHLSLIAFIIFLSTDYLPLIQKTVSVSSVKSLKIEESENQKEEDSESNNEKSITINHHILTGFCPS